MDHTPFEGERLGALSPLFHPLLLPDTLRDEIVRRVYQPGDVLPSKHKLLHKSVPMKLAFDTNIESL